MEQIKLKDINIMSLAGYVTKSPGDVVQTNIHWQCSVPSGTNTFYLWTIFGKDNYQDSGQFAYMSGAMGYGYGSFTTGDYWNPVLITLGELGDISEGDWDCLILICDSADWTTATNYIYDGAIILNALTITGVAGITAELLEAGFS